MILRHNPFRKDFTVVKQLKRRRGIPAEGDAFVLLEGAGERGNENKEIELQ